MHLVLGLVDNRYAVLGRLGSGGGGEVYLARDEVLGRRVALKVLSRRYAGDGEFVERFRREARTTASLSHPNVVTVHDLGEIRADGEPVFYIVMEYVEGITLSDLLKERGALSPRAAAGIAARAAAGLEEAHRHAIVHRDVKPANILLAGVTGEEPGVVKVTDFGISRRATEGTLTEKDAVMGTAQYLSPEQATGRPVGPASDLYSLGVVLYEMLVGRRPFEAGDTDGPLALAMKHVTESPRPPAEANPEVPPDLNNITLRLLAKHPENRHESAAALARDLEKASRQPTPRRKTAQGRATRRLERVPEDRERPQPRRRSRGRAAPGGGRTSLRRVAAPVAVVVVAAGIVGAVAWGGVPADGPNPDRGGQVENPAAGQANAANVETEVGRAVEDYYGAVDREDWGYTYANLDARSRGLFTAGEWARRNQWLADNEGLELSRMDVRIRDVSEPAVARVNVHRVFKNGDEIDRSTVFVREGGSWKHRLVDEELDLFMPGASFDAFVAARRSR